MELTRRTFLGRAAIAAACALCIGWQGLRAGVAQRWRRALRPRAYPGPVVRLDEREIRRRATWLG